MSYLDAKRKTCQTKYVCSTTAKEEYSELHSYTGRTRAAVGLTPERARLHIRKKIINCKDSQGVELGCLGGCSFHHQKSLKSHQSQVPQVEVHPVLEHKRDEMSSLDYSISIPVCGYQLPGYQQKLCQRSPQKKSTIRERSCRNPVNSCYSK